ncbi:MAG: hypothetical protein BZ136_01110 [Methanosphaera sp. rholeuAM74]|nr:MAG: hypothetical protein BZ136_01110 [Methanosphaera sp. rholeuAM74]
MSSVSPILFEKYYIMDLNSVVTILWGKVGGDSYVTQKKMSGKLHERMHGIHYKSCGNAC